VEPLTRGLPRALRAGVVAAACTAVSVGGHQWGGGRRPGLATVAVVAGAAAVVALAGSRRRWTFGRLLAVLGIAQAGCHVLFAQADRGLVSPPGSGAASMLMLAGHALAVVSLAAFLGYGETVLWRLARLSAAVAARVRHWLRVPQVTVPMLRRVGLPALPADSGGASAVLVAGSPRRGPPAWASPR
jgi:hypothetical protein